MLQIKTKKGNTYSKQKRGWGVDKERLNDLLQNIFKTEYRKYRRLQEKAVKEQ